MQTNFKTHVFFKTIPLTSGFAGSFSSGGGDFDFVDFVDAGIGGAGRLGF